MKDIVKRFMISLGHSLLVHRDGPVATIACLAVESYKKRGTEGLELRRGSRRDVGGSLGEGERK